MLLDLFQCLFGSIIQTPAGNHTVSHVLLNHQFRVPLVPEPIAATFTVAPGV